MKARVREVYEQVKSEREVATRLGISRRQVRLALGRNPNGGGAERAAGRPPAARDGYRKIHQQMRRLRRVLRRAGDGMMDQPRRSMEWSAIEYEMARMQRRFDALRSPDAQLDRRVSR